MSSTATTRTVAGWAFVAILLAAGALIFLLTWVLVSPSSVFWALIGIGWISLLFGLVAYLAQAFSRNPMVGRAAGVGFAAMGFTVLGITAGLFPDVTVTVTTRIVLLLLMLVALAITVVGISWGAGNRASVAQREAAREDWRARPATSAFDYSAAHPANVPPPASPPSRPPGAT